MAEDRTYIVVHYAELGTKGKNRAFFVGVLRRNIRRALSGLPLGSIRTSAGRIHVEILTPPDQPEVAEACRRLEKVLGIAWIARAEVLQGRPLDRLEQEAKDHFLEVLRKRPETCSFAVKCSRADKDFPVHSPEINRRVGSAVKLASGLDVDIRNPDLTLYIELLPDRLLYYCDRTEGQRGLPVGASARVLSLLSSGIDSPVASKRIMTRGCHVSFVHFHSVPYTQRASVDLTEELVRVLGAYQPRSELVLIPFAELQRKIALEAPSAIRVVLYRRYMLRLAEIVAKKVRARALVTGESIGQVASQTVENIAVIEDAATLPILRPLIAMSKEEIIREARVLGTYEISTQPYEDCCGYLMPNNPQTHAQLAEVLAAEEKLGPMTDLMRGTIDRAEERVFRGQERIRSGGGSHPVSPE